VGESDQRKWLWLAGVLLLCMGAVLGWLVYGTLFDAPGTGVEVRGPAPNDEQGSERYAPISSAPSDPANKQPDMLSEPGRESAKPARQAAEAKPIDFADVRIWVTYEDGEAFVGPIRVRLGTVETDIEVTETQPVLLEHADITKGLSISLSSLRPGFMFEEFKLSDAELRQSPDVHCVVPATDEPNSTITVDVSAFPAEKKLWLRIEDETGYTVLSSNTWFGGRSYTSPAIRIIRPQRFRVVVIGEGAWQSEWIDLQPGENRKVSAVLQEAATVTAQPVDESGVPLLASVLFRDTGRYRSYRDLKANPGSAIAGLEANPNDDGLATLTHLPPGNLTVCVQGEGTEVVRFELMLLAGRVFDLGVVRLPTAAGRIEVTITGTDSDADFSLEVLQPMAAPIVEPTAFSECRAVIEKLPLRAYIVAVRIKNTGRCYWKNVELTEVSPAATVEFDVSRPPPEE